MERSWETDEVTWQRRRGTTSRQQLSWPPCFVCETTPELEVSFFLAACCAGAHADEIYVCTLLLFSLYDYVIGKSDGTVWSMRNKHALAQQQTPARGEGVRTQRTRHCSPLHTAASHDDTSCCSSVERTVSQRRCSVAWSWSGAQAAIMAPTAVCRIDCIVSRSLTHS